MKRLCDLQVQVSGGNFCLTEDVDNAGGGGDAMSVLHLNGEVAVIGSDSVTDHHRRLTPLGLIQTQTLTQRSHKLLLWFRNLKETKEKVIYSLKICRNTLKHGGRSGFAEDTNLGLGLLLLDHRDDLLGRLFGDILIVPQPGDLGIWGAGDVGINSDLLALLNAHTRLHVGVEGDLWFF